MSQKKNVCFAGLNSQDKRIIKKHLEQFLYQPIQLPEVKTRNTLQVNLMILDYQGLTKNNTKAIQLLLSVNKQCGIIFIGQPTQIFNFILPQHSGKIFHIQKGNSLLEDIEEAVDELNVRYTTIQWSLLQVMRRKIFKLYGF